MKHRNGFLYVQNLNKQWPCTLPSTFNTEDENYLEIVITKAYTATAPSGLEETMKALTDNFKCQSFSRLIKKYIESYNVCLSMKYAQKKPIGYTIPLHIPVRL